MFRAIMVVLVCSGMISAARAEMPATNEEILAVLREAVPNFTEGEVRIAIYLAVGTEKCGFTIRRETRGAIQTLGMSWDRVTRLMPLMLDLGPIQQMELQSQEERLQACTRLALEADGLFDPEE